MKIPDFLKKNIAAFAVSVICMVLGITSYDFVINDGKALGFSEPATTAELPVVTDADIANIKQVPERTYKFKIEGEVILAHSLELSSSNAAAPCNCDAAVPIPYFVTDTVTVKKLVRTEELLALARLSPRMQKYYLIGEWLPGAKVTYIGLAPVKDRPTSPEKTPLEK